VFFTTCTETNEAHRAVLSLSFIMGKEGLGINLRVGQTGGRRRLRRGIQVAAALYIASLVIYFNMDKMNVLCALSWHWKEQMQAICVSGTLKSDYFDWEVVSIVFDD
jgi:hypothetical protein